MNFTPNIIQLTCIATLISLIIIQKSSFQYFVEYHCTWHLNLYKNVLNHHINFTNMLLLSIPINYMFLYNNLNFNNTYNLYSILYIILNIIIFNFIFCIFLSDMIFLIIPDEYIFMIFIFSIPLLITEDSYEIMLGLFAGFLPFSIIILLSFLVTKNIVIGLGDLKLMMVLGLLVGYHRILSIYFLTFLFSSIYSLTFLIFKIIIKLLQSMNYSLKVSLSNENYYQSSKKHLTFIYYHFIKSTINQNAVFPLMPFILISFIIA